QAADGRRECTDNECVALEPQAIAKFIAACTIVGGDLLGFTPDTTRCRVHIRRTSGTVLAIGADDSDRSVNRSRRPEIGVGGAIGRRRFLLYPRALSTDVQRDEPNKKPKHESFQTPP